MAAGFLGTQVFSTFGSTTEAGEPNHGGVSGGASCWFTYQPDTDGILTISTDGSDFDTVLAVYTGTSLLSLKPIAEDNNGGTDGKDSLVAFAALANTVYLIAVDGVSGATGHVQLSWNLAGPPRLSAARIPNGFHLRLDGQAGRSYAIETSADLQNWAALALTNAVGGVVEYWDGTSLNLPLRFYRAVAR